MSIRWTMLDRFIAFLRFSKVRRYVKNGDVLCDLGCGFNGAFLASQSKIIKMGYGFDKKVDNCEYGNIHLEEVDDLERGIPQSINNINIVTMLALIEHLYNPDVILKEVHRILKMNGKVVMTTPTRFAKPVLEFMAFKLNIISREEIRDHKHYFSKDELISLLDVCGFKNIKVKRFQFGLNQVAIAEKMNDTIINSDNGSKK